MENRSGQAAAAGIHVHALGYGLRKPAAGPWARACMTMRKPESDRRSSRVSGNVAGKSCKELVLRMHMIVVYERTYRVRTANTMRFSKVHARKH